MKVISYQAADGTLFSTQAALAAYETYLNVSVAIKAHPDFSDLDEDTADRIAHTAHIMLEILKANVVAVRGPRAKKSAAAAE